MPPLQRFRRDLTEPRIPLYASRYLLKEATAPVKAASLKLFPDLTSQKCRVAFFGR